MLGPPVHGSAAVMMKMNCPGRIGPVSTDRRQLGTGTDPDRHPEAFRVRDTGPRARLAAERLPAVPAAAEPPARPTGRRRTLGTGPVTGDITGDR
ncbi:hypothetical protein ACFWAD_29655 [Rhodococcus sp. NPDC059969]|uniref:hypothetical protein n=1 Tax=Rhodococcus sp. NPDC059969 TaxID=3347018 RepID=UPI003672316C